MPGKICFQADCPFSELPVSAREDGKWAAGLKRCLREEFASKRELQSLKHGEAFSFPRVLAKNV